MQKRVNRMPWNPFEALSLEQQKKLAEFEHLLQSLNRKLNLISRESERFIRERHTLHSLALAAKCFPEGSTIVDWGTGGGLPSIPLAIYFPGVRIFAVDSIEKKIQAVKTMARRLEIDNLNVWIGRAETWSGQAHYSVSRATAPLVELWSWHRKVFQPSSGAITAACWEPGLICLKGGDLKEEIDDVTQTFPSIGVKLRPITELFESEYFRDKFIVEMR